MNIPKYVQDLMGRASFDFSHADCAPGYTIQIQKSTPYAKVDTLRRECERLAAWARRNGADAIVHYCPKDTHYRRQVAIVTITDPCMKDMEAYIPGVPHSPTIISLPPQH